MFNPIRIFLDLSAAHRRTLILPGFLLNSLAPDFTSHTPYTHPPFRLFTWAGSAQEIRTEIRNTRVFLHVSAVSI